MLFKSCTLSVNEFLENFTKHQKTIDQFPGSQWAIWANHSETQFIHLDLNKFSPEGTFFDFIFLALW